ncbi:MAG TPA: ISLre2 family transposase [Eubacteriaceae bacterium]|jgi:hypothetical protein|nr:ISLre2 family transposase [Eubacteriaceae bacterium]
MLKQILSETEINFNDLEKEIFKIGCQYAQNVMVEILRSLDKKIAETRDKKQYRHKGKRKTTIKTLMGEVEFERILYERTNKKGEKTHTYLLDKTIGLETFGNISTNLAFKIIEHASISSFRNSAKNITDTTGQSISHGGVWNLVQSVGEKVKEIEDKHVECLAQGHAQGEKETKILFEEADGVWINMQGKDRPKRGRRAELKVAVAYDGWELESKDRYRLRNKVAVAGFDDSKGFQKRKEGVFSSIFNIDEVEIRILNGDGATWIKGGLIDETVHYQLDPFHLNREIVRKIRNKTQRKKVMSLLSDKKVDEMLKYINKEVFEQTKDLKEKDRLTDLYRYLLNNKEGLIPYKERGLSLPNPPEGLFYRTLGTMEHHICDIIAQRMKNVKASWSRQGAENLGKILTLRASKNLVNAITSISKIVLPGVYTEEIYEVLSASKSPQKDGKGYRYPRTGAMPFTGTFVTNGRKAIQNLIKFS